MYVFSLFFLSFSSFVLAFFYLFHHFWLFFSIFHYVSLFFLSVHSFSLFFFICFIIFHCFLPRFRHCSLLFFQSFHHFSLLFSLFSIIFHCFCFYFSLLFIVFHLFNVILWALIRLKNTKTDKIEYFRDPGVTWLQIIYLEAFHCVERLVCWFPRYVYIYIR